MNREYALVDMSTGAPVEGVFYETLGQAIVDRDARNRAESRQKYTVVYGPDHRIERVNHWRFLHWKIQRNHLATAWFQISFGPSGFSLVIWTFVLHVGRN